jgi:hypothetical protein
MMNGGERVECQISDAAMDELAGVRGTPSIARQAQFVAHRDTVDQIASGKPSRYRMRPWSKKVGQRGNETRNALSAPRIFAKKSGPFNYW